MITVKFFLNIYKLSFFFILYILFCLLILVPKSVFGAEVNIFDDLGNQIFLKNPANRIIVLGPSLVETFFSIGAGSKIIGVDEGSDYPNAAIKIKKVASYNSINFEEIVSLSPDLIVVWSSGFSFSKLKKIRDLGIPVYLSQPKKLDDIEKLILSIGYLTDNVERAIDVASNFANKLRFFKKKYKNKKNISVFYQVWDDPLQTLNGDHIISDVISLCGGKNIFHSIHEIAPKVTIESVILNDPNVILIGSKDKRKSVWFDNWSNWPIINAVRNEQVFIISPDLVVRESPRIIHGIEKVCDILEEARDNEGIING